MKKLIFFSVVIGVASLITLSLEAFDKKVLNKQDRRVTLNVSIQETELILKALGKLPLEESGNLFFSIQNQAQAQLAPPAAKKDTTSQKPKKP